MMFQTVLVGLDWGETVDSVSELAVELAIALDASVKAIYVEDVELIQATEMAALATLPRAGEIPADMPNWSDLEVEFQSEERVLAKRFLRLVADTRIRGSFLVERGEIPKILVQESRSHDLLVLGKYSEHPLEGEDVRPLGRHVEEVLRKVWVPVVLVPPGAQLGARFLLAYDGSAGSHRVLATLTRLARATSAELEVLSVGKSEASEVLLGQAEAYLAAHRVQATYRRRTGDAADEILAECDEWGADLVGMGAFGTSRRKDVFGADVAVRVLEALDRPALLSGSHEED